MIFNGLILAFGIFCLLYYLGMGIFISFSQSMLWLWPLASLICFLRFGLVRYAHIHQVSVPLPRWLILCWRVFLVLGFSLFFYVESFIVSASFARAPDHLDAIIVLGAKVNDTAPSGALFQRIETAADYLRRNPDTVCIASGGQGDDEGISEARCIYEGLTERSIAPERIILEECSDSTEKNFLYSVPMLPGNVRSVGVVTSNFHIYRALLLAKAQEWPLSFYGIPAYSSAAGYLHYAIREFCALVVLRLRGII